MSMRELTANHPSIDFEVRLAPPILSPESGPEVGSFLPPD